MKKNSLLNFVRTKPTKRLVTIGLYLLIAAMIIVVLALLIWQWQLDWHIRASKEVMTLHSSPSTQASKPQNQLPDQHIFGQSDVPVTDLSYRVTGTVKVNNGMAETASKAYISIDGQISKVYKVGDVISPGVTVYGITPNEVILKNHGRLEKLPLPRAALEFKPTQEEDSP